MNKTQNNGDKLVPWSVRLAVLGVVFGDIGTSPLYALRECFSHGNIELSSVNLLGVLSLIFWALIIIISIKYLCLVLRADNRGEGGNLALMALTTFYRLPSESYRKKTVVFLGLFGACLLYGDSAITPAISVLSAVEGLTVINHGLDSYVIVLSLLILTGLFYFQKHGTKKIGFVFGPIMLIWFLCLGAIGFIQILNAPTVLKALNPLFAINFFAHNGWMSFLVLTGVFLTVTGGEALYADMGHFGAKPIRFAWFTIVLPSLVINYFGQGAALLVDNSRISNPFYKMVPEWGVLPLVVIATVATIIASQAVITGAFSITSQAVQLGYLPRLEITHTSEDERGQIYISIVNWLLFIATIFLVLQFKTSSNLASAYGIAVSGVMTTTTILVALVALTRWKWNLISIALILACFLSIDLVFLGANIAKVNDGGWVTIALALIIFIIMTTWYRGRQILSTRIAEKSVSLNQFVEETVANAPLRIAGTAIFMCRNNSKVPAALLHNFRHNRVLHEKIILLTLEVTSEPYVEKYERYEIKTITQNFLQITAYLGFMEKPNINELISGLPDPYKINTRNNLTFFIGKETLFATKRPGMALWRERIFVFLSRNSEPASNYFKIPTDRAVEIGLQIEL